MRAHQVRIPVRVHGKKTYVVKEPKIFRDVTEREIAECKDLLNQVMGAHRVRKNEAEMLWKKPIKTILVGTVACLIVGGGVADVLNLAPTNPLWLGAKEAWRGFIGTQDGKSLLGALGLETGAIGFLISYGSTKAKINRADTTLKRWAKTKDTFTNDVLIHILNKENGFEPRYSSDDVYLFEHRGLPDCHIRKVVDCEQDDEGNEIKETKKITPLDWGRFKREGQFELVMGEYYEEDGRFNPTPRFLTIPETGLFTGVFVIGPTGSGKSQAVLLPILDQFIGYYSWVKSESDLWFYDLPKEIEKLRSEAKAQGGAAVAAAEDKIKKLLKERARRQKLIQDGEDGTYGYEAPYVFLVEPKNEMWYVTLKTARKYGREKDYIELGTVTEKYHDYLTWKTRLEQGISGIWAFAGEKLLERETERWLVAYAKENAIITPKAESEGNVPASLYSAVYGVGLNGEGTFRAITRNFGSVEKYKKSTASSSSKDLDESVEGTLNDLSIKCATPFCFPVPVENEIHRAGVMDVGPLGFGTANEPWLIQRRVKNPVNNQAIFTDAFSSVVKLYCALGWNFVGLDSLNDITEGVFTRRNFHSKMAVDQDALIDKINSMRNSNSAGSYTDNDDVCEATLAVPIVNPVALLYPSLGVTRTDEEKAEGKKEIPIPDKIREALADLPASKKEGSKLNSVIRKLAPPSRSPGKRKYDYRQEVGLWLAERERTKYYFMQSVLNALEGKGRGRKNLDDLDKALGKSLTKRVFDCFGRVTPSGIVEAMVVWFQHSPGTVQQSVDVLRSIGWTFNRNPRPDDFFANAAFDQYFEENASAPDEGGMAARLGGTEGKPTIDLTEWHNRNRVIHDKKQGAILSVILNSDYSDGEKRILALAIDAIREIALGAVEVEGKGPELQELAGAIRGRHVTPGMGEAIFRLLDHEDKKLGVRYEYDPRVTVGEQLTDDPIDVWSMPDTLPRVLRLGPWDSIWSEGIGLKIWEPLREVVRDALNRAATVMGEREAQQVREILLQDSVLEGKIQSVENRLMSGYRIRREMVIEESLNYITALEDYLKAISPYYKCDTPFSYGYSDFGGIGDCCGLNKFNPLHNPSQTTNQLASGLMAILQRGAGSGDTSFWADAGVMTSENMVGILRAAFGYVTVASLFQAVTSDAYVDLALSLAERRIREVQAAQSGVLGDGKPNETLLAKAWAKRHRLSETDMETGAFALPASAKRFLPRVESETELKQLREYFETGQAFITKEWRGSGGSFASDDVKPTVKLNLLQQLTPLTKDIGGYCFSPDDPEGISFPTFLEARDEAKIIVTRFQQTLDPKLGSLVIGMAIQQHECMVLGAKGRMTEAQKVQKEIATELPAMRKKIKEVRDARANVAKWLAPFEVTRGNVDKVNNEVKAVIEKAKAKAMMDGLSDPQQLAESIAAALWAAEKGGEISGALTSECDYSLAKTDGGQRASGRVQASMAAQQQTLWSGVESFLRQAMKGQLSSREEEIANKRDLRKRYDREIWRLRQEILNLLSAREEINNNTRLSLFVIDEYQGYCNFAKKGGLSDELYLAEARAGRCVNVWCTQAPAAVKSAASAEQFRYFLANMRFQVCLGSSDDEDQKMLSDLWGARLVETEEASSFSVNYEGIEKNQMSGKVHGSKTMGASRTYSTKKEMKKWVEPHELRDVPTFRGYVAGFNGVKQLNPQLVSFVPYYMIASDGRSGVSGEPLCQKTFCALIRDGEIALPPLEKVDVRELMYGLRQNGASGIGEDLDFYEQAAQILKAENGGD